MFKNNLLTRNDFEGRITEINDHQEEGDINSSNSDLSSRSLNSISQIQKKISKNNHGLSSAGTSFTASSSSTMESGSKQNQTFMKDKLIHDDSNNNRLLDMQFPSFSATASLNDHLTVNNGGGNGDIGDVNTKRIRIN